MKKAAPGAFDYMTMKSSSWNRSSRPEYRTYIWQRQDWLRGGTIEMHRDGWGRREFVRKNVWGDVTFHRKPDWEL